MREVNDLGMSLTKYSWDEQQPIRAKIKELENEATSMYKQSVQDYMKANHPDYDPVNKYAHYIHLGTPGEQVLQPIKSWEITPEIWKNKSRAHTNKYSKKLSAMYDGGPTNWLDKYQDRGEVKDTYHSLYGTPQLNLTQEEKRRALNPTPEEQKQDYLRHLYTKGSGRVEESVSPIDILGPAELKAAASLIKSGVKSLPKAANKLFPDIPNNVQQSGFLNLKGAFQKYPKGPLTQEEILAYKSSPHYEQITKDHLDAVNKYGDKWTIPNWAERDLEIATATGERSRVNPVLYGGKNWGTRDYIMAGMVGTAYPSILGLHALTWSPPAVRSKVMRNMGIQGVPGGLSSRDTTIDITNRPMDYAKVNQTADGQIIIGGEFIEDANNTVRKAKDWLTANDTYSDKNYPSKDIQSFYGIENGKFKVGKASDFKSNTEIVPRRFGATNINKAVLNGNEMRLLDSKGNPIYQNTPNTGKFILYSPSTKKSQFTYINSGKSGVKKVNDFLKKNKDAQYIHLDNGRYEFYGINESGLTQQDFQNYYEQDLKRKGNPGYNLIIQEDGGELEKYQYAGSTPKLNVSPEEIQRVINSNKTPQYGTPEYVKTYGTGRADISPIDPLDFIPGMAVGDVALKGLMSAGKAGVKAAPKVVKNISNVASKYFPEDIENAKKTAAIFNNLKFDIKNFPDIKDIQQSYKTNLDELVSPEGLRRLKELGVEDPNDFIKFAKNVKKTVKDINTEYVPLNMGAVNVNPEQIKLFKNDAIPFISHKAAVDHEYGHLIQDYLERKGKTYKGLSDLDIEAVSGLYPHVTKDVSDLFNKVVLLQPNEAKLIAQESGQRIPYYFFKGSEQSEPLAHLRETKRIMKDQGIIKDIHENITPEMINNFRQLTGNKDRIASFLQNTPEANKALSDLLNKTPAMIPIGLGAAGSLKEEKQGGQLKLKRRKGTGQNIQSSVNDLFMQNELLFGPPGKRRFVPYKEDGGESNNTGGWLDNYL